MPAFCKIKDAIHHGCEAVRDQAIRIAPAGPTGNLKMMIHAEMGRGASGVVKSSAKESHLAEYGTGPRITYTHAHKAMVINGDFVRGDIYNGKMPAKPFLRPAFEEEKPRIEESIEKILK